MKSDSNHELYIRVLGNTRFLTYLILKITMLIIENLLKNYLGDEDGNEERLSDDSPPAIVVGGYTLPPLITNIKRYKKWKMKTTYPLTCQM